MMTPGCDCCDCAACTHCSSGTKPTRWEFTLSGTVNSGTPGTCSGGSPPAVDCTRLDGTWILKCYVLSSACEWGVVDPDSIPNVCSNVPDSGPGVNISLSYFSSAWYLVIGAALYKATPSDPYDCTTPLVMSASTDFGYPANNRCVWPGTVTVTPG